jgi:hypothetical protein
MKSTMLISYTATVGILFTGSAIAAPISHDATIRSAPEPLSALQKREDTPPLRLPNSITTKTRAADETVVEVEVYGVLEERGT